MVSKLFWENPYATQLKTRVSTVDGDDVTLEETIFYAFSGGQESDGGTIGGKTVLEARKEGLEIFYTLESDHNLNAGDEVFVEIDWQRRYKLMRLHFAAEIVLELVTRRLPGVEKIGAHISEDKARIDFLWPENFSPLLHELQQTAHNLITANHTIVSDFSDEATQRRYWRIEGFAEVPCGGTHLKTTGEVGTVRLKRKNVGSNKERVEIVLA
ncbi:alanyl-tRNA editing protein [soil metagenome]